MASKNTRKSTPQQVKADIVHFYGTKPEWVKSELDITMATVFEFGSNEKAVVAEDEKGLYVTGKSYVGAPIFDPYRMNRRNEVIVQTCEQNQELVYTIVKAEEK